MEKAAQQATGWLTFIPATVDSVGRLFIVVWDKSPELAAFTMTMAVLFPFFLVHTWCNRATRDLDRKESSARKRYKGRRAQAEGCDG